MAVTQQALTQRSKGQGRMVMRTTTVTWLSYMPITLTDQLPLATSDSSFLAWTSWRVTNQFCICICMAASGCCGCSATAADMGLHII